MNRLVAGALRISAGVAVGVVVIGGIAAIVVRQPAWGSIPYDPGPRADAAALRAHVEFLAGLAPPRSFRHPESLARAAAYIRAELEKTGARVVEQPYEADGRSFVNVIGRLGPDSGPLVVIGAHYDVFGELPGADDNASGVAGLLEVARLLAARGPDVAIELVAYSTEEPPFFGGPGMGSAVHARGLRDGARTARPEVRAMLGLEMIGYYTERQPRRALLVEWIYPRHGDFAVAVGRWQERRLAREIKRAFRGADAARLVSYSGPPILGADLSDHRNYWDAGFPAVMITDTAFLRNPHYHRPSDTADTLDYGRMARVVDGVAAAALHLGRDRVR